jgi:hypothetical protein
MLSSNQFIRGQIASAINSWRPHIFPSCSSVGVGRNPAPDPYL